MHFIMQRKTSKLYSQAQPRNINFSVIMKTFLLQRHSLDWRALVFVFSNLRIEKLRKAFNASFPGSAHGQGKQIFSSNRFRLKKKNKIQCISTIVKYCNPPQIRTPLAQTRSNFLYAN